MADRKNRQLELMLAPARQKLMGRKIPDICEKAGVVYDEDTDDLLVPSLGEVIRVRLPEWIVLQDVDMWRHLTLLQYLDTADGTPLSGTQIGLSDMRGCSTPISGSRSICRSPLSVSVSISRSFS